MCKKFAVIHSPWQATVMIDPSVNNALEAIGISLSADARLILLLCLTGIIGYIIGGWVKKLKHKKELLDLEKEKISLEEQYDRQLDQLHHTFNSLSQQALQNNNQAFLTLAQQTFEKLQIKAKNDLNQKEKSIENLVKPIQDSLKKTDEQLQRLEKDRAISETKLATQISNLLESQQYLQSETRNLVSALRRPEVRGQWGELTLKRLAELAGMSEHCDFDEQINTKTEDSNLRPDMVINMPGNRQLVVDVKTPLDAYLSAVEAKSEEQRSAYLAQHAKNVKERIKELAMKKYWEQFSNAPDFVVLFIPGDQFLTAALDEDKSLLENAMQQRVILATPTSLVGLLRAIAYGWNQDSLNKNAEVVREVGKDLYNRLGTLAEHLGKLGKNLDSSVTQYNKLLGSYESNVLPGARKFNELGIETQKQTDTAKAIETPTRKLTKSR